MYRTQRAKFAQSFGSEIHSRIAMEWRRSLQTFKLSHEKRRKNLERSLFMKTIDSSVSIYSCTPIYINRVWLLISSVTIKIFAAVSQESHHVLRIISGNHILKAIKIFRILASPAASPVFFQYSISLTFLETILTLDSFNSPSFLFASRLLVLNYLLHFCYDISSTRIPSRRISRVRDKEARSIYSLSRAVPRKFTTCVKSPNKRLHGRNQKN